MSVAFDLRQNRMCDASVDTLESSLEWVIRNKEKNQHLSRLENENSIEYSIKGCFVSKEDL